MITRLASMILKELLAILRDPKGRAVLIIPPIVQLFVFTFAATQEARNVSLGLLNHDRGEAGAALVRHFQGAAAFSAIIPLANDGEAEPLLEEQRALAILVIPEEFSRQLAAGEPATVQFLLDGRKVNTAQIVQGYAAQIVERFRRERFGEAAQVELRVRHWFNPNLEFSHYTVPSLVCILSTLIALLVTALSVARERETGTFDQLLVSPLHPLEILAGKALAALLIALGEASLVVTAGVFAFHIPFQGSLLLLYAALALFLLSIIGIGLFISSLCATQQQAILGSFIFMVPAMLLSGFASPIENMPAWLQTATLANPLRWFMVIARGLFLKAMSANEVAHNAWPLAIVAAATLLAAAWLFRHRLE